MDIELLKTIRAHFADDHVDVVLALIPMAAYAGRHTMRLPRAAYRKGLLAALSYDTLDGAFPECPYDAKRLPNFMRGDNDPRDAWREGSRDGIRIRETILFAETRTPVPGLKYCEYEALTPELRATHDRRTMNIAWDLAASSTPSSAGRESPNG